MGRTFPSNAVESMVLFFAFLADPANASRFVTIRTLLDHRQHHHAFFLHLVPPFSVLDSSLLSVSTRLHCGFYPDLFSRHELVVLLESSTGLYPSENKIIRTVEIVWENMPRVHFYRIRSHTFVPLPLGTNHRNFRIPRTLLKFDDHRSAQFYLQ